MDFAPHPRCASASTPGPLPTDNDQERRVAARPVVVSRPLEECFTLRAREAGGFDVMEAALARKLRALAVLEGRHAVIVEISDTCYNHYTQTLVDRIDGAWVEAVADEFILSEAGNLDETALAQLAGLGFAPPDETILNHHQFLDPPVDWRLVAHLLIEPLVAVYGAGYRNELSVIVRDVGRPSD